MSDMTAATADDIFTIPMPLSREAIDTWVGRIVAETNQPTKRAEALSELQDCQALHATDRKSVV